MATPKRSKAMDVFLRAVSDGSENTAHLNGKGQSVCNALARRGLVRFTNEREVMLPVYNARGRRVGSMPSVTHDVELTDAGREVISGEVAPKEWK